MSQTFLLKKRISHQFRYLTPENMFTFLKRFMSRIVLFNPKLHVSFSNFQAGEIFSFKKFFRHLDEEKQQQQP